MLRRLINSMRKPPRPDPLRPLSPRIAPDPDAAAALERRREALAYCPEFGFLKDTSQRRLNQ